MNAALVILSLLQIAVLWRLIYLVRAMARQTEANLEAQACRMDRIENDLARVGGHVASSGAMLTERLDHAERSIISLSEHINS